MLLHPQVIEKKGKKEFVVLPYNEFLKIQEALEDLEDIRELKKERKKSRSLPSKPLREIGKELGFE
ncbi:MAG: type II toxin-antitoxin system Phd/YefM family antitoxin [Nitrospirales bacterium]|nr:type II toxin-antitoxin system Phd/YefM family antitoxin [Nitrospirales bacterium]